MGVNFSEFKGLIPGTISNLNAFNPMEMFQSFLAGSKPDCQELKMETIDIYNNRSTETHFVTLIDIQNMDPCIFSDKTVRYFLDPLCRNSFVVDPFAGMGTVINVGYQMGFTQVLGIEKEKKFITKDQI